MLLHVLGTIRSAFECFHKTLLVIGSGGSLSAAHLAATLHERRFGHIARPITPASRWACAEQQSYVRRLKIVRTVSTISAD